MLLVINYGGGTNSTALLIEVVNRGLLDAYEAVLVVFADTGSERPETYEYLALFGRWLKERGIDLVITRWLRKSSRAWFYEGADGSKVRWTGSVDLGGKFIAIHEDCEKQTTLPSRAFGFSGCTTKWKQHPIDGYAEDWAMYQRLFGGASDGPVERWIGYDADEPKRVARMMSKNPRPDLWRWRAPLVEWEMGRDECVDVIVRAGLPLPGKSACFLCPSTTKAEIDDLGREHPELLERALRIEREAIEAGNVKTRGGLGGSLNWGDSLAASKKHLPVLRAAGVTEEYLARRSEIRRAFVDDKARREAGEEFDAIGDGIACGCYDG